MPVQSVAGLRNLLRLLAAVVVIYLPPTLLCVRRLAVWLPVPGTIALSLTGSRRSKAILNLGVDPVKVLIARRNGSQASNLGLDFRKGPAK
jgi:hypothetical protein